MKVLYVSSGPCKVHEPIDRYIHLTFSEMNIDYKFFDLSAHFGFFDRAFKHIRREYGIDYSFDSFCKYASAPLLHVVNEFEPDLVFTMQGINLPKGIVSAFKKMGALTAAWIVDDPYEIDGALSFAGDYDYVFTVESGAIDVYRGLGYKNVFHLPLAAFPGVHADRPVASQFESDVCFIGSGFYNRIEFFDGLADYFIDSGLQVRIIGQWWDSLRSFTKLRKSILDRLVYAADAAKYYAGAKINLNLHRASDAAANYQGNAYNITARSPNNRTFEIAACGGFQLVDNARSELNKYFEIGKEVDTFSSPDELIEKIEYYLNHEEKRKEMARRARERCLKEHTFHERLEFVLEKTSGRSFQTFTADAVKSAGGVHNG